VIREVHVAGEPMGDIQQCARCGYILVEGIPQWRAWSTGAHVEVRTVQASNSVRVTTDAPTCKEAPRASA
jgi:hypothetical protein